MSVVDETLVNNHYLTKVRVLNIVFSSKAKCIIKAGPPPPLDLSVWSFLTFLHHGIEEVERHLL